MATKAELEAELASLRAELDDRRAAAAEQAKKLKEATRARAENAGAADWLAEHGISAEDAEAALRKVGTEIGNLHDRNPMLTLLAAFGGGLLLGRLLK